jgi:hypothetical protein
MPHIVFDGKIDLEKIGKNFAPIVIKSEFLIKIKDMFPNSNKQNALFSTIVIDEFHQEFFIQVLTNKEKTTVRLYPLTDPKKTDSVKKAMVLISQLIKSNSPKLKITKTNLQDYLSPDLILCQN